MSHNNPYQSEQAYENEIGLLELISFFWDKKLFISFVTLSLALISVLYSLSISNTYTSKALLMPSNSKNAISSKMGDFSSLSSLAGISLPDAQVSKSEEAIQRIKSYEFFSNSFMPYVKLENLIAVKGWNSSNNSIAYDKEIFDEVNNKWIRVVKPPKKSKPSLQEAYKEYRKILFINQDKKTSFVTISISHQSPNISKAWVDIIVNKINQSMRESDQNQAKKSISYLSTAQQSTNIQSIKEVSSLLLERQMQTLMLTSSNEDYVFKTIDSPIIPEEKSAPNRKIIVVIATFMGFILSCLILFFQYVRHRSKDA
jgi:uncharacterized protein involved in exopolysaccharide biosynthesis